MVSVVEPFSVQLLLKAFSSERRATYKSHFYPSVYTSVFICKALKFWNKKAAHINRQIVCRFHFHCQTLNVEMMLMEKIIIIIQMISKFIAFTAGKY